MIAALSDTVALALISAVATLISTVVLAWMQKSTKVSVDQGNTKLDQAVVTREKVHDLVNNNYSKVSAEVKTANGRLEEMQKILDGQQELMRTLLGKIKEGNGEAQNVAKETGGKIEHIAEAVQQEVRESKQLSAKIQSSEDTIIAAIAETGEDTNERVQKIEEHITPAE